LDKDNAWYCNICKDHVEATKKIEIYSAPPVLIFCFQRFKSHNIYFKEKLEDKINFPITDFDMAPFVASETQKAAMPLLYDLYAVSNHYGSLAFGHYTAYCKNPINGLWYDFNDSSVSELDGPQDVASGASYVLYYKRKDFYTNGDVDFNQIRQSLDGEELNILAPSSKLTLETA
jgi:ubiquitin carboxyl-terminal hydrolase 4/11